VTEVGPSENLEVVYRWRRQRFRHDASLRLRSLEQARRFVDDVGFCLLFPAPGMVIPTLWEAICGEPRPIPQRHHDEPELDHTWRW
jgi:hypothetical protein